jgi:hypothetical protein
VSVLAPWALWAAVAVSAAVIALHVLASKNPRVTPLPTARFIPDLPLRATARALRLSDVSLMLLRVAIVMLAGLAFARPVLTGTRRAIGRVVMVDHSGNDRDRAQAADSAARYYASGDLLIAFDSAAHRLGGDDALRALARTTTSPPPRSSLSAALAAGMREASQLRGDADSVELVLISPFALDEWDAATEAIRATWPGRLRLVRAARSDTLAAPSIVVRHATPDDPVRAAVQLLPRADTLSARTRIVRLDRGAPSSSDTSWAAPGGALVRWPAAIDSSGWTARPRADTAGAVIASDGETSAVVVSTFVRAVTPAAGRVIARWADGAPAATERTLGAGCLRDVAIPVARAGDLALRESTRRLVAALAAPCGDGPEASGVASDSALAQLRGSGPLVATRALETRTATSGRLPTWLLIAALALLLVEPLLRRQRAAA